MCCNYIYLYSISTAHIQTIQVCKAYMTHNMVTRVAVMNRITTGGIKTQVTMVILVARLLQWLYQVTHGSKWVTTKVYFCTS